MSPLLRAVELEDGAAPDDLLLILYVVTEDVLQPEHLRLAVDEHQHIDGAGVLQLRVSVKLVEKELRVGVAAVFDDYLHAAAVGFVAQGGDALDALRLHQLRYALYEHRLVHLIRDLVDLNAVLVLDYLAFRADADLALRNLVEGPDYGDALAVDEVVAC